MIDRIPAEVFPPGEFIRDELEARGWTQSDFAEILGRPAKTVSEILSGKKAITPETAQGIGEAFGVDPLFWMNLESAYRLSLVRTQKGDVARRARLFEWAPVRDMIKRGWISDTKDLGELERRTTDFLGVNSVGEAPSFAAAARKSTNYGEATCAQSAWLARVRQLASTLQVRQFDDRNMDRLFTELRRLTVSEQEARHVPRLLTDFGIRFLIVEHLPRTRIDGVATWLDASSPVVALSIRYDRIDAFWHTLAHELAHIARRHSSCLDEDIVDESGSGKLERPEIEIEADAIACEKLVPKAEIDSFIARIRPRYSRARINQFANQIQVHPGIIVGQLQRRDEIKYAQLRDTLVKVREIVTQSAVTDGWGYVASII
jgi:HTH-type transcriptional regulator / antitoxin HigA